MTRHAAFISYAHCYGDWVAALQRNLERCLASNGETRGVFLDQVDLGSGRSWVGQLQEGIERAEHLVLVAAPEALASPRVEDEWQGFVARRRDWSRGRLHVAFLADVPLPAFLEKMQYVDFRGHDEARYRDGLRRLAAGLLGRGPRDLPELPSGVEVPASPESTLEGDLRRRLVGWLEPLMEGKKDRRYAATVLGLERNALEGLGPGPAASAAVVLATAEDDPLAAATRIAGTLADELDEDESLERLAELDELRAELEAARRGAGETGLVGAWLRRVVRDHERLVPYFQQHTGLELLDRVYVQLELRRGSHLAAEEMQIEARKARPDRPSTLRELLDLDPAKHPWVSRRWVVLGDPGAGKTTLLRHLAAKVARDSPPPWVPVFESLPRLLREPEWLLDRLERQLRRAGDEARGLAAALERRGWEGRLLLLFDGLDEVPREVRGEAEETLRAVAERWPETPVVVASRPIGYRPLGAGFTELELLPFDRAQRRKFLARWLGRVEGRPEEERAERAAARLEDDPALRELSGNPLYLTLMALLIEQGASPARNRPRLYDQVFGLLMSGEHRPEGERLAMDHPEAARGVLRHLGEAMTRDNSDAEPRRQLETRLYEEDLDALRGKLERVPRWREGMRYFLEDLADRTGILGPHDGRHADWRFWHRTFREALAAEALAERFAGGEGEAAILEHARSVAGDESRWAEPYALLAGQTGDPDALVRSLAGANRALGLRAVATSQGLGDDTLREILDLSDDWQERAKVYERVPELIDEPERALALLDQLRRRTTDGNDLFFLERAAAAVAEKWPDAERHAGRLRRRFYDHIPAPPADHFRWVETPRDDRVELWREIPAGEFQMGSSEGEGDDDEHPRHRVEITAPFRMAAVPVTNAQFAAFDRDHEPLVWQGVAKDELPHHPVVWVTWYQAVAFCRWLSSVFEPARLPTEAEWEYACRAGTETRYWKGDAEEHLDQVGWYNGNSEDRTHRVGEKEANRWGLYDVHGNVFEWTQSEWTADYSDRKQGVERDPAATKPADPAASAGGQRVIRGGGYGSIGNRARAAYRYHWDPRIGDRIQGFRVMLPAVPAARAD